MRTVTFLLALISIPVLLSSCTKKEVSPESGNVYIQYEQAVDGFRDLKQTFTLNDYVFTYEPKRSEWSRDANFNFVDSAKVAALVKSGSVKSSVIHGVDKVPVSLPMGYHILDDGGPNPVGFWVNGTDKPLIWMNSNYSYSCDHAEVKIMLKKYPAGYNLKWWFFSTDMIDAKTTGEALAAKFINDDDGADFDAGFYAMPATGRSFRAPKGVGFVMIKTPAGRYEAVRINVGEQETVTFTAP